MRTKPYPDYVPVNRGTVFESPVRFADLMRYPVQLHYTEEIDMFAVTGTTETMYGAVLFSDGPVVAPPLNGMFTVHATGTTTLTSGSFTTVPLTLDQALPAGTYSLVGARVQTVSGIVFKVIPAMGPVYTPGGMCVQAYDGMTPEHQRYGGWGEWLRFQQNVLPSLSVLSANADTAEDAWFDRIKLS
jgi:hypothetical protein